MTDTPSILDLLNDGVPEVCKQCGHWKADHHHRGWLPSLDCDACAKTKPAFNGGRIHPFVPAEETP